MGILVGAIVYTLTCIVLSAMHRHRVRASLGGAELGRGGQGVIETMDELPLRVRGAHEVQLVYVDLRTGEERRRSVQTRLLSSMVPGAVFKLALEEDRRIDGGGADGNVANSPRSPAIPLNSSRPPTIPANSRLATNGNTNSLRTIGTRNAPPPMQVSPPPKTRHDPMREEFEGNLELVRALAAGNIGRRKHVKVLAVNTPFIVRDDRFLVVGVVAGGADRSPRAATVESFPMYRRLGGNLSDFSKRFPRDVTLRLALEVTKACLDVLETLLAAGAHHCDVKEENMLYDVVCDRVIVAGRRPSYPPPCRVEFSVSDFGLVRIKPARVSNRGTPGSICPLAYDHDDKGRADYEAEHVQGVPVRFASASTLWDSYERERVGMTKRATSAPAVHEKGDLFATGVMLLRFARLDREGSGTGRRRRNLVGAIPQHERVVEFVYKLLRGDRGSIWTVERAQKEVSALLKGSFTATRHRTRAIAPAAPVVAQNALVSLPRMQTPP